MGAARRDLGEVGDALTRKKDAVEQGMAKITSTHRRQAKEREEEQGWFPLFVHWRPTREVYVTRYVTLSERPAPEDALLHFRLDDIPEPARTIVGTLVFMLDDQSRMAWNASAVVNAERAARDAGTQAQKENAAKRHAEIEQQLAEARGKAASVSLHRELRDLPAS